jgi:hypothetical protein
MRRLWEYRVRKMHGDSTKLEKELNQIGQMGWELVSVTYEVRPDLTNYTLFLKRETNESLLARLRDWEPPPEE